MPAAARTSLLFSGSGQGQEAEAFAPPPAPEAAPPEAAPPEAAPAPVSELASRGRPRERLRAHPGEATTLVKTSQKFSKGDLQLFEQLCHQAWQEGPEKLTRDHLVRCLLRAVLDLDLELDLHGLALSDQDELVERMRLAIAAALDRNGYR